MRQMQGEKQEQEPNSGAERKETEELAGVEGENGGGSEKQPADWKTGKTSDEIREIEASLEKWKEEQKRASRAETEQVRRSSPTLKEKARQATQALLVFFKRFFINLIHRPIYSKTITHDEWMLIRAETGYIIYNYEFGFLKNPKVTIKSPAMQTDYITDPNGYGHLLIRRGLPIGIGSQFKVKVEIR